MAIFKRFKTKRPATQMELDFEKEKKKRQMSFNFTKFLKLGKKKKRPEHYKWYEH